MLAPPAAAPPATPVENPLPSPAMTPLDLPAWLSLRDLRAGLARRAVRRPLAADSLFDAWSWARHPAAVAAIVGRLHPPRTAETFALAAWAFDDPPDAQGPHPEVEWDRLALDRAARLLARQPAEEAYASIPEPAWTAGGLYLLGRLGEEHRLREAQAWEAEPFPADARDAATAALWRSMFERGFEPKVAEGVRKAFGREVRRSFRAVALSLHLPPGVADLRAEQAIEALETLSWGAHIDLATRVVETAGEPVAALSRCLDADGRARVAGCVRGRTTWMEAWALLLGDPDPDPARLTPELLAMGVELVVALRLRDSLNEGRAPAHALGLPGQAIVAANRSRIRGRLRVVARQSPERLLAAVLALPSLRARTSAALSRYAWDWAWREARVGFGFDPDRMRPPACELPEPAALPIPPLGPEATGAVRTLLLALLGRGCWEELEAWLGGGGRGLSARFYRVLAQLPDRLADPVVPEQRSRGYTRLREHLADGGLDDYTEELRAIGQRVALVPPGRERRRLLIQALGADWDETAMPLPEKQIDAFVERLASF